MNERESTAVVRSFYDDLWNDQRIDLADELLAPELSFRGSLGAKLIGVEAFKNYLAQIQEAFPDWHNQIEELIVSEDRVIARLTWSATHRNEVFGIAPTGRRISYEGVAIFRLRNGKIADAWIVGDTAALWSELSAPNPH